MRPMIPWIPCLAFALLCATTLACGTGPTASPHGSGGNGEVGSGDGASDAAPDAARDDGASDAEPTAPDGAAPDAADAAVVASDDVDSASDVDDIHDAGSTDASDATNAPVSDVGGDGDGPGDAADGAADGGDFDGSELPDDAGPDDAPSDADAGDGGREVTDGTTDTAPDVPSCPLADPDPRADEFVAVADGRYLDSFRSGTTPIVWSQGGMHEALIFAFEATGDSRLLDAMIAELDVIAANTAEARDLEDELLGGAPPAWPTDGYACGHFYAHAVHTAIVAWPMAWLAETVLADEDLRCVYEEVARRYIDVVERALGVHDSQWAQSDDTGRYRHPGNIGEFGTCDGTDYGDRANEPLPFNMMLAIGRAHLSLGRAYEALGDDRAAQHLDRAVRLARFFEDNLSRESDYDGYQWLYAVEGRPEDAAHGSLDMRVAVRMHEAGLFFSATHLERFANTYLRYLTTNPHAVRSHLVPDYGGGVDRRWQQAATRWTPLAGVDPNVWHRARYIRFNADGNHLLARAMLLRYAPDENVYPAHASAWRGLPVFRLWGSTGPAAWTGLYRPSDTALVELDGAALSSCAHWEFEAAHTTPLAMRYRQTATPIVGDSCSGDACGTSMGIVVFTSADGVSWSRQSFETPLREEWRVSEVTPDSEYRHVLACRGGAGHARENLQVSWVRTR